MYIFNVMTEKHRFTDFVYLVTTDFFNIVLLTLDVINVCYLLLC